MTLIVLLGVVGGAVVMSSPLMPVAWSVPCAVGGLAAAVFSFVAMMVRLGKE